MLSYFYPRFGSLGNSKAALNLLFITIILLGKLECIRIIVLEILICMDLTKYSRLLIHLVGNEIKKKERETTFSMGKVSESCKEKEKQLWKRCHTCQKAGNTSKSSMREFIRTIY